MRDVKEFICFGEKDRRAVSVQIRDRLLQLHYFQPLCYKKKKAIAPSVFLFVCLDRGVFVGTVETNNVRVYALACVWALLFCD